MRPRSSGLYLFFFLLHHTDEIALSSGMRLGAHAMVVAAILSTLGHFVIGDPQLGPFQLSLLVLIVAELLLAIGVARTSPPRLARWIGLTCTLARPIVWLTDTLRGLGGALGPIRWYEHLVLGVAIALQGLGLALLFPRERARSWIGVLGAAISLIALGEAVGALTILHHVHLLSWIAIAVLAAQLSQDAGGRRTSEQNG